MGIHTRRVATVVCLLSAACGAADQRVDPDDLALRDLLGVQPAVVAGWDDAQRAAARQVLAGGLDAADPLPLTAPVGDDPAALVRAVATADGALAAADHDARGLVIAAPGELAVRDAPTAAALLVDEPADPVVALDLDPRAWTCPAAPCDLTVLAALAADAAPEAPLVRVRPAMQLAAIAALGRGADGVPVLLVNPVVTAVGLGVAAPATGGASAARGAVPALPPPPLVRGAWTYGSTIGACVQQVQSDCATCRGGGLCENVWPAVSGMDACTMLDADAGRNYDLVCIDLALSLADVRACVQGRAASCTIDDNAIDSPAELANNAAFLDDATCADALAACLTQLYGGGGGGSDGCSCSGCDCGNNDNGSCSSSDQNADNCNNNGCSGGSCGGGNGGCGGGGGNGSCSVAATARGPGPGVALVWVLLPVPVALAARRRPRRPRPPVDPA